MSWAGKILNVDLTTGEFGSIPTSAYVNDWLGGEGIGTKLIYDEVPPEVTGLDPRNLLTFNTGPLTGTLFGNKLNIMAKSPIVTNSPLVTASMGGQFPSELKFAGYDHIAIKGKADKPVYLYIHNDEVQIKSAEHLWGTGTQEVQELIKEELNEPDAHIACIGQAGENQVASALIMHDIQNAASHGGLGAVMGSKNLKAVVVRGTKGVKTADPKSLQQLWEGSFDEMTKGKPACMNKIFQRDQLSTHADMYALLDLGQWGYGPDAKFAVPKMTREQLLGDFDEKYRVGSIGCSFCPVQCQGNYALPGIGNGGVACFTNLGMRLPVKNINTDVWWEAIIKCQDYGINTLEITSWAAWLMVLYERGLITADDTDGVAMEWGSKDAIMTVLDKVCNQEGFGLHFRGGLVPAAKRIANGEGLDYAFQDRNISIPLDIPERGVTVGGSGAIQMTIGATQFLWWHPPVDRLALYQFCAELDGISQQDALEMLEEWTSDWAEKKTGHRDAWKPDALEGKAKYILANENAVSISDILGHCDAQSARLLHAGPTWSVEEAAKQMTALTGRECSEQWLLDGIQRKRLLQVSYNMLCERMIGEMPEIAPAMVASFMEPIKEGYFEGQKWDLEKSEIAGEEYCELRGCDPDTGLPTKEELERLGIAEVGEMLEAHE